MEVDALLANASALKDARGDGDEAGGTEPHFHDSCGGDLSDAGTDRTSRTLDQIEREVMALKDEKVEMEERVPRTLQLLWKIRHRLSECWLKDHDIKAKGGGLWSQQAGGRGSKGQGLHVDGQTFNAGPWKSGSTVWAAKG